MDSRLTFFLFLAFLFILLETFFPRRKTPPRRRERWPGHFLMIALGNLLAVFLLPWGVVEWSEMVFEGGIGIFPWFGLAQNGLSVFLTILAFDLLIYFQHRLFHWWTPLWRLHRVHHSDTHLDATSALRFHPLEIYLSYCFKLLAVALLGPPPQGVFLFEIILSGCALFNHANLYLPAKVDQILRFFVVTPDFHRLHHSLESEECHAHFGFNLPWWDYLFGTYCRRSFTFYDSMVLGNSEVKRSGKDKLPNLLCQPFRKTS